MTSAPRPLVSVITPSFNQAEFLEQAMRSVLDQDYAPVEYLVVDGGSQDGSLEIIQRYAGSLAWWVSEPDRGQAEAINKGLQQARGEIVAWLNSDDLYFPGAIRQAVAALAADPGLGMVFGDALTIDAAGRPLNRLTFPDWGLNDLISFRIICQPAVFMRRSVLEQAGWLDPSYHLMLDHQLWIRMAQRAPIRHVGSAWAAARHHAQAKNVAQSAAFGQEALRILAWLHSQPDLAQMVNQNRRKIEAGARRLSARYLLDGGHPGPALRDYGRALYLDPRFALQHWHRMLYALLSLAGARRLGDRFYQSRQARRTAAIPASEQEALLHD